MVNAGGMQRGAWRAGDRVTLTPEPQTRGAGCATAIVGLSLAASGLPLLLLLLGSTWGGASGPISLVLLLGALGFGLVGTVWVIIGAAAILEPRRRHLSPPERTPEDLR